MSHQTSSNNIIGRDALIARIWLLIEQGKSIRFTAERRIGKTTVMRKMRDEPNGTIALYIDLERVDSPIRFVEVLTTELKSVRSITSRLTAWLSGKMPTEASVSEVSVKFPDREIKNWQTLLEALFDNICTKNDERIVLLLDELPYMLQKIHANDYKQGTHQALEILDLLRAIRQKYAQLNMVFAGSVGIHHVIKALKGQKSASQPINDLDAVEISPLARADAIECARLYCQRFSITLNEAQLASVAQQCNDTPFYLEKLVSAVALNTAETNEIDDITLNTTIRNHLSNDVDPWEMRHFKDRLPVYYIGMYPDTNDQQQPLYQLAETILDSIACSTSPLSIDEVFAQAKARHAINDRALIIDVLADLAQDHYLESALDAQHIKRYRFKYSLIESWWLINQGLSKQGTHTS